MSIWTEKLIRICSGGVKIPEIGCGTGVGLLRLAKNGREVAVLDYPELSVE